MYPLRRGTRLAWLAAGLLAVAGTLAAQDDSDIAGMSRQMRLGVRLYEKGEDLQAMDHFMEVLTRGDPAERNMANEYINLITKRMNSGDKDTAPLRPSSVRPVETVVEPKNAAPEAAAPAAAKARTAAMQEIVVERSVGSGEVATNAMPLPGSLRSTPPAPPPEASASQRAVVTAPAETVELPKANKALMKKEIRAKIRNMVEGALRDLRGYDDIRLLMRENGDPEAIGIPTPLLFQNGIAFQKDAQKVLDAITRLTYGLGTAQVIILPEGTSLGDAKVLDMRRTMGISSYLYSAGVAPARVKVNLLNSQVDIPKPMLEFKGIIVLFVYDQPLGLVVESSLGEEAGPPLSLGIFPASFRPDRGEGSIVEFSVQDPPAGLVSWKFQLLQPAAADGKDLAPLQEVVGGSPVFHQIYWNGRQNYFGQILPVGRYETVLTATDAKNRQRTLHRWIQLVDVDRPAASLLAAPPSKSPVTAGAASGSSPPQTPSGKALASGAPSADLGGEGALIKESVKGKKGKKAAKAAKSAKGRKSRTAAKKAPSDEAPAQAAAPAEEAPASASGSEPSPAPALTSGAPEKPKSNRPSTSGYTLDFGRNTHQMTPDAERQLAQIAETMVYYPMETLKVTGYAKPDEADSTGLAKRRAQMVAGLLVNKYQIDDKKIQVSSEVSDLPGAKVVATFVKAE